MTYKIAIIYDVSVTTSTGETIGWAFYLRAISLRKYAPPDFEIDIFAYKDAPWGDLGDYDLCLNLEYAAPSREKIPAHVPLVISYNSDSRRRHKYFDPVRRAATYIIFNNFEAWSYFGKLKNTCAISNGYDLDLWHPTVPIEDRPHRLLWCGSSSASKGKGYQDIFQPLEKIISEHGFECDFRPIDEIEERVVRTYDKQRDWYNSGSYVLCASQTEGTPNFLGEAVFCGCVAVSVSVGNIQEWGHHGENCVLCERTPESFIQALLYARENRERLSAAGMKTMHDGWSYGEPGNRAQFFYQLFRRIIDDGSESIEPFSFLEKHWSEI